ncbi:AMP-dependent synthetase/ligase [Microbacterium gilvum]|uniref:AMP-dependent synthetase/ligase n=1 Tax=Microbacterium gilvum TaxID=1336204 RepID=A0ABP9A6L8_9MICO
MRETATPFAADHSGHRNVTDLLVRRERAAPDHAAFDVPEDGGWRRVSTTEFADTVRAAAKGLIAQGVGAGDAVAIMSPTRYGWAVADLAVWFAGGVVVPVYDSSSPEQVAEILHDAGVRAAFSGDDRSRALLESCTLPLGVWSLDDDLDRLAALGEGVDDLDLEARRTTAGPDTPATIVYTSGTSGAPRGAVLTHANFLGQVLNIAAAYRDIVRSDGSTVIFLPLAHVLARGLQLICLASGMRIAHLSAPSEVIAALPSLRPTFLVVVPRVLEKIAEAAAQKAATAGLSRVWDDAVRTAVAAGSRREAREAGARGTWAPVAAARTRVHDAVFFRRVRALLGGRIRYILSGGAPLPTRTSLLFRGMGVPVVEGYGLTETTAPLTGNLPGAIRSGTVGVPLPGSAVRIADDGEVLARGVGVFSGYRDPRDDADAFVDGWFRTGDLGRLDDAGRLILEGRTKDVVTTSQGKTVSPARWEREVESSPLVAYAVTVGDDRPYLTAMLLLDREAVARVHDVRDPRPLDDDPAIRALLEPVVTAANARVARSERVRRFALAYAEPDDRELVTPTLKIRRRALLQRASDTIDRLYL